MSKLRQQASATLAVLLLASATQAAPPSCVELGGGAKIGNATILAARAIPAGKFTSSEGYTYADLPAFCRVVARAAPTSASNIIIEAWLPEESRWNGKILGTGNGGFAGSIRADSLAGGLRRGYAVSNTDMGTYPAGLGIGYAAGNGRPETVRDWGHRATHEMAVLSKVLVERFYGKRATRAYFAGCSTGGHQGLAQAQRYPEDYDAILAGAPGHNRTHLHTMFTKLSLAALASSLEPASALATWNDGLRRACVGKDGGAPSDAFLTDPMRCRFSPRELQCKAGEQSAECLSEQQVQALESFYDGVRNPRTGKLIYPPLALGAELSVLAARANPSGQVSPTVSDDIARWVFGPDWDAASFDFDRDIARIDAAVGSDINALDPDLSRFAARGGKLILFHGWSDSIVTPLDTIIYYDRIRARGVEQRDFVRLFMAPGVNHCGGGPGPDVFGQHLEYPAGSAEHDLLAALDRWAETGAAPQQVIASKYQSHNARGAPDGDAKVVATRPLCAYPNIARYDGSGDAAAAASFVCTLAEPVEYERPAEEYLR